MPAKVINPFNDDVISDAEAETAELATQTQQAAAETQVATSETTQVKPETQAPATETQQQPAKQENYIPLARFNEVNERMKAAERERNELAEKWARMDERAKQRREAQAAAEAAAKQAERPDPALDPVGAQLWDVTEKLNQQQAAFNQWQQQFQQTTTGLQQNQEQAQFSNWVVSQAQEYARQDPEYFQKATHVANQKVQLLTELGMPQEEAVKVVQAEAAFIARVAQQYGRNFAPIIAKYGTAWGYGPTGVNGNGVAQTPNGQAPAIQQQQPNARIQQLQRGQQAQGIGHLGGGNEAQTAYRNYTPAQIAALSEREWSALMANPATAKELRYAVAMAEGIDPTEMGRV
jgi:hypothetical protein